MAALQGAAIFVFCKPMKSLVGQVLFEPLAAIGLLITAAGLAVTMPSSPLALVLTGVLCGALLRGLLPVNLGDPALADKRWQRVDGVSLPRGAEWLCLGMALVSASAAAVVTSQDLREALAWLATATISFRFVLQLPLWTRRG